MGFYVNPRNESKEDFLVREGVRVPNNPRITWASVPKGYLPVVLLRNSHFTAAGIAFCENELDVFTRPEDNRPRAIFMVQIAKLLTVAGSDFADYARSHQLI